MTRECHFSSSHICLPLNSSTFTQYYPPSLPPSLSPFSPSPHPPRNLASGALSLPTRERKWTNMKGLQFNLTTHQRHVRNYVFGQARKKVMKMTNGLYPSPLKIMEVCGVFAT